VYENDPADIDDLGWDRFVSDVWASIYVGYHSNCGIRTIGRRWSDLLQGALGCSQELADELVRIEIMQREDRGMLTGCDPLVVLAAMDEVLADMGLDLAELNAIRPAERSRLVAEHARLRRFLRDSAAGLEDAEAESG
jgi:hypothetical protein